MVLEAHCAHKCDEMSAIGGLEDNKTVSMWSVSALNLDQELSCQTVRRILADENAITSGMDSHGNERRKKWFDRSNTSRFSSVRM